jgi:DNA-directed RNA polymerase subunit RPC12/RpoP
LKAFACPQCGASLESKAIQGATVECHYCHSSVIVPAEMRPAPPLPPPQPVFSGYEPEPERKQAFSFRSAITILVVFTVGFLLVILFLPSNTRTTKPSTYAPGPIFPLTGPALPPQSAPNTYVLTFGGEGTGPGLFQDAHEVAVDGAGNIYVSDDTQRIQKFDSEGKFLSLWTIPSSTQYVSKTRGGPDRLLANHEGKVYVVIGGVMLKYDGTNGTSLGTADASSYVYDAALTADGGSAIVSGNGGNDEVFVLNARDKTIKRIDKFISAQLENQVPVEAVKIAVDGVGNIFGIYAIGSIYGQHSYDYGDLAVFRFTSDGKYVNRFGGGGNEPGQFDSPNAIAVDGQSRIYICDLTKGIHVYTSDGRYLETLKAPYWVQGMAFDAAGNLLVVGDNKVTKLIISK